MRIKIEEIEGLLRQAFKKRGVEDYEVLIDHFIEAELRGHSSHGLQRVIPLLKGLDLGTIKPRIGFEVIKESKNSLLIDAKHSIGITLWNRLISREFNEPIYLLAVRNASHIGFLGYYTSKLTERGLVSIMFGNAEVGIVKPGTAKQVVSTAPISVGIPPNYVLDMSLASTSRGKILQALRKGEKIPKGVAVNEKGIITEDPAEALKGGILPIGGFKGFLLALTLDLLTAYLTGSAISDEVTGVLHTENPPNKGEVMIIINPSFFAINTYALEKMRKIIEFPGEHGMKLREKKLEEGYIEVDEKLWEELNKCEKLCV